MKEKFVEPMIEFLPFDGADIVTTSGGEYHCEQNLWTNYVAFINNGTCSFTISSDNAGATM